MYVLTLPPPLIGQELWSTSLGSGIAHGVAPVVARAPAIMYGGKTKVKYDWYPASVILYFLSLTLLSHVALVPPQPCTHL